MAVEIRSSFDNVEDVETPFQKPKNILCVNGTTFITFTVIFVILLQFYNKGGGKGSKKGKSVEGGQGEYLGIDDLPKLKPPIPIKLIGNVPQLFPFSETLNKAVKWAEELGDIFTGSGFLQTFVLINSGPLIQTLMKSSDFGHVTKAPIFYSPMRPFVTNGVLVSKGTFWQRERKILLKSQSYQSLKAYMGMLNRHARKIVDDLEKMFEDGKTHEINGLINSAFLGVISEMITGANLDRSDELEQYHHNFTLWRKIVLKQALNPLLLLKPIWMLHPSYTAHEKALKGLFDFAKRRIKEHKDARAAAENKMGDNSNSSADEASSVDPDKPEFRCVLDELLDAEVDERQIIDEVNTMMFGGHETGASTIHCLCFALALNPQIQELARKEADELFDDKNNFRNGGVTYDAVQIKLKYVERCLLETLRMFPPAFAIARKLETPLKIEYKNRPVLLPVGTNIIISPYMLHRKEEYFPEPLKFDPNRFLPEESANRHAYSYIPFSAGPRNCLGLKFAMVEMKLVAAHILRNFEITTTDKMEDIPLLPYVTLTPAKDYTFQFKRRYIQ